MTRDFENSELEISDLENSDLETLALGNPGRGGGGALPYMAYIGTCREIGYGFWRFSILK